MRSFNLSAWAVRHPTLVLFFILALAVGGTLSYLRLGRSEDPSFTIKVAVVTASWPGATATEMQEQVADPIEKKLQELPYFDKVETYAKPGFTAMQVVFRDNTPPAQVPYLFYVLRKKITDLRPQLPAGLVGPSINDEYGDVDSLLYMITAEGADPAQLKAVAEALRQDLLRVPDVVKVNVYGTQDEKIFVEFSHAKLATLGIEPRQLFDALTRQNAVASAGVVQTDAQRIALRVSGAYDGVRAVADTPIEAGGKVFRVGDVASVTKGFVDPPSYLVRQEGRTAVGVGVVMARGGNLLTLGKGLDTTLAAFEARAPQGIEITRVADQPAVVEHAVGEFARSFVEALGIVLVVSFISLGLRTGIVVALSVPLVLAAVFMVMNIIGLDLHRITLGALIIALGLLVDDAIIAVEMMVVKMEQGVDRMKAASFAWDSTAFPMLTGTLVTAAGFLPVGFAASSVGEYAGGIFTVVAIALIASWVVAVVFTPYLGVKLLPDFAKHRTAHANPHAVYETRFYRALRAVIAWCVRRRLVVVLATVAITAVSIVGFGRVQQQFFPLSERPELFFQLRLPEGSSIQSTLAAVREAEGIVTGDKDLATWTTYVGQGSPRFWLGLNPQLPNEAFAEIVLVARDVEARERVKARIEARLAEGALSQARVRVDRFNFGPPVGFPVQFRVVGADPGTVRDIAFKVRDVVKGDAAVVEPHLNWNEQTPSVRLVLDQDRARLLGLDPTSVAQTLDTLIGGVAVTTVRDRTEKIDVVARAVKEERVDLARIGDLTIVARNGTPIPLSQVARIDYGHEEPILWRRNRDMAITVRADVVDGVQPPDVSTRLWTRLADVRSSLPPGYRIDMGGAIEESAKGNASLAAVFPVMILAMATILMIQLQSFSRLFLVILTAPLGIVGASLALNIANKPFGFVALLGLIALAGMIMRNTVILVDQIEHDVADGLSRREAIVEATVRRARPVVLTALAAILAMIPLSTSAFWGPMAITIMGGLFVATFLTLLFLPALYALWFRRSLGTPVQAAPPAASLSPAAPERLRPVAQPLLAAE